MQLDYSATKLQIKLTGLERMWALKALVSVPYSNIDSVEARENSGLGLFSGIRMPGTHIPGVLRAGVFYHKKKKLFLYLHKDNPVLKLELRDHQFDEILISLDDPYIEAATIQEYLNSLSLDN